ncbi:carbamoyltransferase [Mucilaginibacter sabulilitoris]|uniref:Carbamoyltransferase n=1 Tax=Mucilaginibacter sabulilitoris TaxID=1173583 RepID=A0ABZ0TR22_9SPHI|nr:carbamoyltransferase [Mucilaginibacter sabulilitoris]WPU95567.1 carbamoyltransferase [Mucilaginibacter sabulilitoris]
MYILGISAFYHDSAACLIMNDQIITAAQEERFSRKKNDAGFPSQAIKYCLDEASISLAEVAYVVYYEKPFLKFERLLESYVATAPYGLLSFLKAMPIWVKDKLFQKRTINEKLMQIAAGWQKKDQRLLFAGHHQAHAASAFFPSPFYKALILSIDGVGEWTTTSVWIGEGNKLTQLEEMRFPHSVGLLYSAFTAYLGFKVNSDEYKVMGLAPYGKAKYADLILKELVDLKDDGSFRLNMRYFNYVSGLSMFNTRFANLFKAPVRAASADITEFHMDIAASIQHVAGKVVLSMINHFVNKYQIFNLCLAGGVALNCVINGKILKETLIQNLWIQPAAGDAGGALGAAYSVYHEHLKYERTVAETDGDKMKSALLGPCFSTAQVEKIIRQNGLKYQVYERSDFLNRIANDLDNGKVVGWFDGRMEFGPRALGSRSILGDCRRRDMQRYINQKVKFRESFRPFAPVILADKVHHYYDLKQSSPYMLIVADILDQKTSAEMYEAIGFEKLKYICSPFPAVTHVNGSSRIQTVAPDNQSFYELLTTFYKITGCPAIVNTSFNIRDQPIVCSPQDAIDCFLKTDIDILAIGNCIITKTENVNCHR